MTLIEFRGGVLDGKLLAFYANLDRLLDALEERMNQGELFKMNQGLTPGTRYRLDLDSATTAFTEDGMIEVSLVRAVME